MSITKKFGLLLALLGAGTMGVFAGETRTPPPGSAERKEIMDALRIPAEKDLGQPVAFVVGQLRVSGSWAFARVEPQRPDGSKIDYSKTRYAEAQREGMFDAGGEALLRRRGGEWEVVHWRFGGTDTEIQVWQEKYHLPGDLFE